MSELLGNIRFYVLLLTASIFAIIYLWVTTAYPSGQIQTIKLTESYALAALTYLYLALLVSPLISFYPQLPFKNQYLKARRAIGVSAFLAGLIHASFAFFGTLGGFAGLGFLDSKYLIAISLSATALFILTLMAATSFDFMIKKLTFTRWKMLHRFVYLAAILTLIHALMLGSDFTDLSQAIPQIFLTGFMLLATLEALRFDKYLKSRFPNLLQVGPAFLIVIIGVASFELTNLLPSSTIPSLGIHAQHIQLAKDAQNQVALTSNVPGLNGDPTKRYTVTFLHPDQIAPDQDTELKFLVYDASSGQPVDIFSRVYEKTLHLIIVDNELNYFTHIHPDQVGNSFVITTKFPHPGRYHLYLDFQPLGAIEQQIGVSLDVGQFDSPAQATQPVDTNLSKIFGQYQISLNFPTPLLSSQMAIGNQKLTFTLLDAQTKQPITNLQPYLAAFGHLVMINEQTYDYLHVHPTNLVAPKPTDLSGPTVEFLPLGLYGPIKPGIYRVFGQFNPGGQLMTADFTIQVQ